MADVNIVDFLFNDHFDFNVVFEIVVDNAPEMNVEPRRKPTHNTNYVETTVPLYTINEFRSHFRMSRESIQQLMALIAVHIPERHLVSLTKQVLFTVWMLSKPESFLAAADRFGISSGTGHYIACLCYIFINCIFAICQLKEIFINWPNAQNCNDIAIRIQNKSGIPGVVGAIDGTHIVIKQPKNNAVDFFNRKDVHSVILQAVCDDKLQFTDVFIGMPGRMHDARVFRNSPIYNKILGNPPLLPPHQHLLGDAAYPLLQNLIKPYRDNGHLTAAQMQFNQIMSSRRSMVERAYGLLKGKWRRLKYLDMSLEHKIPEVILAACILHNFVLKNETIEELENDNFDNHNDDNNVEVGGLEEDNEEQPVDNNALIKRDYLASLL